MFDSRTRRLIHLTRELIEARSLSGQENRAAAVVGRWMSALNFDRVVVDNFGNVWGCITGNREGRRLLLDGHLDTVDVGQKNRWTHDPFGGEELEGRLYGRGSSDMKGAVAGMILAASDFAADRDRDFAGQIFVSCTVCEEIFEGVAARKVSAAVRPDWVIIGESSDLNIKRGQRGRAELRVQTEGKSAHSSNPDMGRNAAYDMMDVVQRLRRLPPERDSFLGEGILELTDVCSFPYPGASVIPEYCVATYDRRLLPGDTKETVLEQIRAVLCELVQTDSEIRAEVWCAREDITCYTGARMEAERFFPAWSTAEDHPLVVAAEEGLRGAGLDPQLSHYSFCTNGSHYAGELGLPTIGFGPSPERLAHTTDEYIQIEDLISAYNGYRGILGAIMR